MDKRHRKFIYARDHEIGLKPILDTKDLSASVHEYDVAVLVPLLTDDEVVAAKLEQIAKWLRTPPTAR